MEILKILIWPLSVIIIVIIIILLLKDSLKDLLKRITKLKYGETVAEVSQGRQDTSENSFLHQTKTDKPNDNIEKALGIFSDSTLKKAKEVVETESKVNELADEYKKIETLIKYSQALYLILSFDRIYNIIFGSQIYILEFVNTNYSETKKDLKTFYDNAKVRNPEFYETYSYDEYFDFLVNTQLITSNAEDVYNITWLGRDFLKYLIETGKTTNKKF